MKWHCLIVIAPAVLLASGCADQAAKDRAQDRDPAMSEAIEGQLLVDPDLSQQNMRAMAVLPGGPVDPEVPLPDAR